MIATSKDAMHFVSEYAQKEVSAFVFKNGRLNLLEKYHKNLVKIEDLPVEEYLARGKKFE